MLFYNPVFNMVNCLKSFCVQFQSYSNTKNSFCFTLSLYSIFVIAYVYQFWTYPILELLNIWQRTLFIVICTAVVSSFYFIGEFIHKMKWGKLVLYYLYYIWMPAIAILNFTTIISRDRCRPRGLDVDLGVRGMRWSYWPLVHSEEKLMVF